MTPAPERKTAVWPLAAIGLLIVLLAGFLVVKISRRERSVPLVVKEPPAPPPTPTPVPPPAPEPPPPRPPPPPPREDKSALEFDLRLQEARRLLSERKWDAAKPLVEALRALRPSSSETAKLAEDLLAGLKRDADDRAEAARREALRVKQVADWAAVREKAEKDSAKDLWDAAWNALEGYAGRYPASADDEELRRLRKKLGEYREEADKQYRKNMGDAERLFAEGRFAQAVGAAEAAVTFYPERRDRVREFQEQARRKQFELNMVRIPSTPCWIGSDDSPDERPLRSVRLPAFLIDQYEVSNDDFLAFVQATGHPAPPEWRGRKPARGRERHPVVSVTWDDAAAYAKWAGKRLPTAEEWEVAARGLDRREYPWGSVFLEKEASFPCNSLEFWQVNKNQNPGTTPVDAFDRSGGESPFGVQGLAGNVWEWTATAVRRPEGNAGPELRILKGGSFMTPRRALRAANVFAEDPRLQHVDVGFRCARDLP
jgi:formylglycine-generating enzyme required for sulfatase activity